MFLFYFMFSFFAFFTSATTFHCRAEDPKTGTLKLSIISINEFFSAQSHQGCILLVYLIGCFTAVFFPRFAFSSTLDWKKKSIPSI